MQLEQLELTGGGMHLTHMVNDARRADRVDIHHDPSQLDFIIDHEHENCKTIPYIIISSGK